MGGGATASSHDVKYMLLIYHNPHTLEALSEGELNALMNEAGAAPPGWRRAAGEHRSSSPVPGTHARVSAPVMCDDLTDVTPGDFDVALHA